MKTISIKTADGNRYDYQDIELSDQLQNDTLLTSEWIIIKDSGVTRMFYKPNVVCITIKDA